MSEIKHPSHYTSHPSGIEAIEICKHEDYRTGCVFKYMFRYKHKGTPLQDLLKAREYIDMLIVDHGGVPGLPRPPMPNDEPTEDE